MATGEQSLVTSHNQNACGREIYRSAEQVPHIAADDQQLCTKDGVMRRDM